ncbi:MAG: hypothetical protein KVP17_000360 [Porospora cf. gigantea B]|uniref:uncharacterized protein n=1 Tax=Porospora cf. gigantea B TaxID=2853592 RepID=UPI003571B598|nr:MAG: hypothetical protein KVP17_000360 [Porospora cf. gigantea B]
MRLTRYVAGLATVAVLSLWLHSSTIRRVRRSVAPPIEGPPRVIRGLDSDAVPEIHDKYLIFRLNLGYGWGDNVRGLLHAYALGAIHDRSLLVDWKDPSHGLDLGQQFGYQHFVPRHVAWNTTAIPPEFVNVEPRGAFNKKHHSEVCTRPSAEPVDRKEIRRIVKEIADNELGDHVLTMYPGFSWAFASVIAEQSKNVVVQYHGMMAPNTILESFEDNADIGAIMTSIRPTWSSLRYFNSKARKAKPWISLNAFHELFEVSKELVVYLDRTLSRTFLLYDPADADWVPQEAELGGVQQQVWTYVQTLSPIQKRLLFGSLIEGVGDFLRLGPFAHCRQQSLSASLQERLSLSTFEDEELDGIRRRMLSLFPPSWKLFGIHFREGDKHSSLQLVGDYRKKREDSMGCFAWIDPNRKDLFGIFLADNFEARDFVLQRHRDRLIVPLLPATTKFKELHMSYTLGDAKFVTIFRTMVVEWLLLVNADELRTTRSGFNTSASVAGGVNNVKCREEK